MSLLLGTILLQYIPLLCKPIVFQFLLIFWPHRSITEMRFAKPIVPELMFTAAHTPLPFKAPLALHLPPPECPKDPRDMEQISLGAV